MLNELKDLAQKKSKAKKVVQEYNKKKEEERIRKSVQSDKLEEFFEPVTKAVAAIPAPEVTQQLVPAAVPVPPAVVPVQELEEPIPPEPFAIEEPQEPGPSGLQVSEITTIPGGLSIDKYDAEKQLQGKDLTIEEKINKAKNINRELGKIKKNAESPAEVEFQIDQNRAYYQNLKKQIGKALATKGSYKLDTDGYFSDLLLDLEQLFEYNKLYGLDEKGQQVIDTSVNDDFIDLVTKRYNPKKRILILQNVCSKN